ncbi:hypothetical protein SUGI_0055690 [Cryptomeria japonica]|nr:hypothetical protein SUGI_0055690 [Cryptomeria japonica]
MFQNNPHNICLYATRKATFYTTLPPLNMRWTYASPPPQNQEVMLQILLAVCFSAAPLALYLPPSRYLTVLVGKLHCMINEIRMCVTRAIPRVRDALIRLGVIRTRRVVVVSGSR